MMAAFFILNLSLLLHFLCNLDVNNAINLDARFSIIKKGTTNSYFGYSVAQHQIVDENNPDRIVQNVFLIGSPKKEGTGGAIYRCDASSSSQDCQQITEGLPTRARSSELIEDQWLGVSVASQGTGKKAVACAHRFIKDNKALGVCHVFMQALDETRFSFRPCEKVPNNLFMQNFGLCQAGMSTAVGQTCAHRYVKDNAALGKCFVLMQNLEYDMPFIPCKREDHKHYMKDFGLCQAGLAVSMGQDDSLLMGAPGSVFWRGAVFLTNVTDELGVSQAEIVSPYADPSKVSGSELPTPTKSYTYQGYALTMGRFDSSKDLYYVSGAIKGGNSNGGNIVFYKIFTRPERSLRYDKTHIVNGPISYSGFGSSLLAVDINNDGFDDLIVGAPYYYSRNRGGAFYVYLGGNDMINKNSKPTEILSRKMGDEDCKALKCDHARFGMSLAKLGDINMDGYQDFVVGAPYEGNGAIYIYHGQKDAPGFTKEYVQRITASDLPDAFSNVGSFGHSLSGGMDLDGNGYPDVLVGAYESDMVALIRSRPIIRINPSMDVFPKMINLDGDIQCNIQGVKPEYKNRLCVGVTICLNFTTKPADSIQLVPNLVYTLEAEGSRRVARVELQDAEDASKKIVTGKTVELKRDQQTCATEIALIKGKFDDKLNPIEFTFKFDLSTDKNQPSPYPTSATEDINGFPILETQGASADAQNDVAVQVDFVKECGDDQECKSNLQFESKLSEFISKLTELIKDDEGNYELLIQKKNDIVVEIKLENEGEAAYLTRVFIQKPPLVSYLETYKEESSLVTCQDVKDDDTMIMCDQIGNPLRTDDGVDFKVRLNVPKELAESTDLYNITAWVNTSSTETTPDNDKMVMKFKVINKAEIDLAAYVTPDSPILCQGEPRGASAIDDEEDIGAAVKHNYIVRNYGPGVISESYITIYWPYEVAGSGGKDGKYLLYLMRKPKISGPVVQCNDKDIKQYINPLGIQEVVSSGPEPSLDPSNLVMYKNDDSAPYNQDEGADGSSPSKSRTKREAEPRAERATSGSSVVVMSCMDNTAKCFEFRCKLGKLEPGIDNVQITMEARLWESTLLSDYRKAADVKIISWGNLTLPKDSMIQQKSTDNDMRRAITRAIPDFKEVSGQKVKWWIILVAVIVGIVVLLVVILILYKVGFFRRKRPEEMQMYKAEKKQNAMLTDYEDGGL